MIKFSSKSRRVIIVEDDHDLRESIIKYLKLKGFDVVGVGTALNFYAEVAASAYAVAILDLALPDQDGLVIAKFIRANSRMRILMLTARMTLDDRLAGYESGADIYLVKPVDFRELAASLESLFGRIGEDVHEASVEHACGPERWLLSKERWLLLCPDGNSVKLTAKEYLFLSCLAEFPGLVISRADLLSSLGYPHTESSNRSLESLVYRMRKKVSPTLDTPIKAVSGEGYTFCSPIAFD
ncbi:response regulator transcription factor [Pelodictyon luteolum]|uniref:Two component transcriptional regulator, winged helix family n=1 Tax=Chlorobium luteolum (strain DSM 273 / BCRC 81028 / 2530) TaxID=319225 RepID=Q3B444_CHLL3|nr:response regulator transcription factor [Pelodictyon luteolum]ABB23887.1 two component transcriptional regulator, winged helix family [Pelodictyon luteolum DSM 273]